MNEENHLNSSNQIKINFKSLVILLAFAFGIYFLIPRLVDAQEALQLIMRVNKIYLLLAVLFEVISYVGAAYTMGVILSRFGYRIKFWDRFKISSIAAFAIHFFPVGSFGEGAVDFYFLRKRKVEAGSILILLILRIIITYIAFFGLFLFSLILVPTVKELSLGPRIMAISIFLVVLLGIIYLVHLFKNKDKFHAVWQKLLRPANFFLRKLHQRVVTDEKSAEVFEDIYQGLRLFSKKKRNFAFAILGALIYWLGDMLCFYFVFLSFGYFIHFGVLMFSYSIGSLAGMISFIPGGLGATEGSMGLILTALGTPSTVALVSILLFRFFSFWIWIPVGLYSFFSLKKTK